MTKYNRHARLSTEYRTLRRALFFRYFTVLQSRTKFYGKVVSAYAQHLTNDVNSILPVLCYFSTQRVAQSKREDFGATGKNNLNDRRCGYIGCLDDSPDRKALEAWCLKMEQTGFKKNSLIPENGEF